MLLGFAKKGLWVLLGAVLSLVIGALAIIYGIDPEQELAEFISKNLDKPMPIWMGIPVIQAIIFAFGVGVFVLIDWLDKNFYREWFIKNPPRDIPIWEAADYIVNDTNTKVPENFDGDVYDYLRMEIKEQALCGNCIIWGRREIKLEPYSVKDFDESYNQITVDELKDINFNELVFGVAYGSFHQTDYVDNHWDRQGQYYLFTDLWLNRKNVETLWPKKLRVIFFKHFLQRRKIHPVVIQQQEDYKNYRERQESFKRMLEAGNEQ